jgi:hypothetical protein
MEDVMKKNSLLLLGLFLFSVTLRAQDLGTYPLTKVTTIQVGSDEGMIGWEPAIAGGYSGPTSFVITAGSRIYVPDRVNKRLDVFDWNFDFIKCIYGQKGENAAYYSSVMKADSSGNIIALVGGEVLKKINPEGKDIFSIKRADLPERVYRYVDFFPLGDGIFFYNDKNSIQYISQDGKIESTKKAKERLKEIALKENQISSKLKVMEGLPENKITILDNIEKNPRYLMLNGKFYSSEFSRVQEYFDKVSEVREYIRAKTIKQEQKNFSVNLSNYMVDFLDYDSDNNSYWEAALKNSGAISMRGILIFSSFGELIDGFYFSRAYQGGADLQAYPTSGAVIAVAPNGDIYFMVGNKTNYTIYKAERTW